MNNPCAVKPTRLDAAIRKYRRRAGTFETISFGLVASCDGTPVSLALPIADTLKFGELKSAEPAMARLWDLASEIETSVFGPKDLFHDRTEPDDLALQRIGEKLLPEVISAQYDPALALASGQSSTFRSLLSDYRGPIPLSEADPRHPVLLDQSEYHFTRFVEPIYPPLARMARIQGKVELKLTVNPATGAVEDVSATGHPLLKLSALDVAKRWVFEPLSVPSCQISATLIYSLNCP